MFLNRIKRKHKEREPLVYYDPMGQTNGAQVEDIPEGAAWPADDPVNHPSHYTAGHKIEVIQFLEDWMLPFHLANCVKYICRAGRKDPAKTIEDLEKGRWYLDRYISLLKEQEDERAEDGAEEGGAV